MWFQPTSGQAEIIGVLTSTPFNSTRKPSSDGETETRTPAYCLPCLRAAMHAPVQHAAKSVSRCMAAPNQEQTTMLPSGVG